MVVTAASCVIGAVSWHQPVDCVTHDNKHAHNGALVGLMRAVPVEIREEEMKQPLFLRDLLMFLFGARWAWNLVCGSLQVWEGLPSSYPLPETWHFS